MLQRKKITEGEMNGRGFMRISIVATALFASLAGAGSASAATYTVDNFADASAAACAPDPDPNPCNLRGAITAARNVDEASTIKLLPGTYTLSLGAENGFDNNATGDLDWVDLGEGFVGGLTIEGAGPGLTTINAGGIGGLGSRILEIEGMVPVSIRGVTFKGGRTTSYLADGGDGGAILANGATGPVVLSNVRFEDNATVFPSNGDGGAIHTKRGNLTIESATFFNNSSTDFGGAIAAATPFQGGATLNISNSTFDRNKTEAGGAGGGAIVNAGDTVSDEADTVMTVTNSTFDGNSAAGFGGAIDSFGGGNTTTNLNSVTITGNDADTDENGGTGGGIQNGGSAFTVKNSLIAANSNVGIGGNSNCSGAAFVSLGGNVTNDLDGCGGFPTLGDIESETSLLLGPLAPNGGVTSTRPLLAGNAAIDRTSGCPATDQRGVARPQGAACDTGAFELVPPVAIASPPATAAAGPTGQRAAALKKCKKKKSKKARKKCKRKAQRLPI